MNLYDIRNKLNMGVSLSNIKLRVTYYSRVSTDSDEQKKSLKNQIEHFDEMINNNKNWEYVQGYMDDGISGTTDYKRDNFMKMIDDARNGLFDLIVTKEISRFSRNTLDSIKYTRELLSYGVAVLFINDNINTALPDSELRLTIMASMAQDEIRRLSERVKFGMSRSIKNGTILGNDMLYGYKKDKGKGVLTIAEDEAKIVRRIYSLYAIDKLSISKIVKTLNSENIKTNQNKKWCISTISRMMENPKYKGYYCGKKSEVIDYISKKVKSFDKKEWIVYEDRDRIPPIVNEELWNMANDRLLKCKSSHVQRNKSRYIYSSKIYCKDHNCLFHRRKFRKNNKDITWVCKEYLENGKKSCDSPNIREKELDSIFYDLIIKLNIKYNNIINLLISYYKNSECNSYKDEIIKLEKDIKMINIKKDKILELLIQNEISNYEFHLRNNEYTSQIEILNDKINSYKKEFNKDLE